MKSAIVGAVLVAAAVSANAESVAVGGGFFNGRSYRSLEDSEQATYLMGIVDGLLASGLIAKRDAPAVTALVKCGKVMKFSGNKLRTIVDIYMDAYPDQAAQPMAAITANAITAGCRAVGSPID